MGYLQNAMQKALRLATTLGFHSGLWDRIVIWDLGRGLNET
jgi:uncharacterized protein (DUF885 family)